VALEKRDPGRGRLVHEIGRDLSPVPPPVAMKRVIAATDAVQLTEQAPPRLWRFIDDDDFSSIPGQQSRRGQTRGSAANDADVSVHAPLPGATGDSLVASDLTSMPSWTVVKQARTTPRPVTETWHS
jgi:hypothetical protein